MQHHVEMAIQDSIAFTLDYENSRFFIFDNLFVNFPKNDFENSAVLFEIRRLIDSCNLLPARNVQFRVILNTKFELTGKHWKILAMGLESMKHHAAEINQLSFSWASVPKSTLLSFLKGCKSLQKLAFINSFFDNSIDVGVELLPLIPNVRDLTIFETPEFTSNSRTLQIFRKASESHPFARLQISPFYGTFAKSDVEFILKSGTDFNLGVFPQCNFWDETDAFQNLPIQIKNDALDVHFFFKIFLKHFIFVPFVLLLHPFHAALAQYAHFIAAGVVSVIILPFEELLPARLRPPIFPSHYRHNSLVEAYSTTVDEEKETVWHKWWFVPFVICFCGSLFSLICCTFFLTWKPWTSYAIFTILTLFIYRFHIGFMQKMLK